MKKHLDSIINTAIGTAIAVVIVGLLACIGWASNHFGWHDMPDGLFRQIESIQSVSDFGILVIHGINALLFAAVVLTSFLIILYLFCIVLISLHSAGSAIRRFLNQTDVVHNATDTQ